MVSTSLGGLQIYNRTMDPLLSNFSTKRISDTVLINSDNPEEFSFRCGVSGRSLVLAIIATKRNQTVVYSSIWYESVGRTTCWHILATAGSVSSEVPSWRIDGRRERTPPHSDIPISH